MEKYSAIGLMSGTSLDGVDIAHCYFTHQNGKWQYEINKAITVSYNEEWRTKLVTAHTNTGLELSQLHVDYGCYLGQLAGNFINEHAITVQFIASHGHTIFHTPHTGLTLQIGSGPHIAAACRLPVIYDFRTLDVALGGQGAPLVPIGDQLLFGEYGCCLNLGGIANISFEEKNRRIAYDVCVANMALNYLANQAGLEYDEGGKLAQSGCLNEVLLQELNNLSFYQLPYPKSLGREWFEKEFKPVLDKSPITLPDKMTTACYHIGMVIANAIHVHKSKNEKVLITGGGAFNGFLIEVLKKEFPIAIKIPTAAVINYKEAMVFAFMGVLHTLKKTTALASVTGAKHDSVGGTECLYVDEK